jgi:hypothetical protein
MAWHAPNTGLSRHDLCWTRLLVLLLFSLAAWSVVSASPSLLELRLTSIILRKRTSARTTDLGLCTYQPRQRPSQTLPKLGTAGAHFRYPRNDIGEWEQILRFGRVWCQDSFDRREPHQSGREWLQGELRISTADCCSFNLQHYQGNAIKVQYWYEIARTKTG